MQNRFRFQIDDQIIPTLSEKPVKSLGKWYKDCLNDRESIEDTMNKAKMWLTNIDKSGLPGTFKAWCYQYGILPRILWPLLIYEFPITTVENLERMFNKYLRRWLGVPNSFSSIGLYSSSSKLQLPISSVAEEFKVTKVRLVMMLRYSRDSKVNDAGVEVKTGRKWTAADAVRNAESRLRHRDLVGLLARGKLGIGNIPYTSWQKASVKERRHLVQEELRKEIEESRQARAVGMRSQGAWTRWEQVKPRYLPWNKMWKSSGGRISFLLKSVYDVLPTPTNLCTWGLTEDPSCKLCQKPCNLEHVLSSCSTALSQGRYTWRHNHILREIAATIDMERRKKRTIRHGITFITFVKPGHKASSNKPNPMGILATANDWEMQSDLGPTLRFPREIASTNLRPDIVLWSKQYRQVVWVELTVSWETRLQESHERKRAKYQPLADEVREKGWKVWNLPVEVGCRGFTGQSLCQAMGILGIVGRARRDLISNICNKAEEASSWLWRKRNEASWPRVMD